MRTRYLCAVFAVAATFLAGCTSTTTTTTTQAQTDQTKKRVHTQEEMRKSGESDPGRALEKTDPAVTISPR
jgi:outer membrane biogenesis lipoprotein LolB